MNILRVRMGLMAWVLVVCTALGFVSAAQAASQPFPGKPTHKKAPKGKKSEAVAKAMGTHAAGANSDAGLMMVGYSKSESTQKSSGAARKAKTTAANTRRKVSGLSLRRVKFAPAKPSFGSLYGLRHTEDPLDLKSSAALVMDQETGEVLFSKNDHAVLPIASLTKLMTALVVMDAAQALDEPLTVTSDPLDADKRSRSRLQPGTTLVRSQLMHLALMSSENRAAHTLGAHYPGGLVAFAAAMNQKAAEIGMTHSRFVEPTGLSSQNQSSARDLALLVNAAYKHRTIRDLSTSNGLDLEVGERAMHFNNTNLLVASAAWDIGLQKTGYIAEAGRCLVMQAKLAGRKLVMVFLDSAGRYSRLGDAERVRKWLSEPEPTQLQPTAVKPPRGPTA